MLIEITLQAPGRLRDFRGHFSYCSPYRYVQYWYSKFPSSGSCGVPSREEAPQEMGLGWANFVALGLGVWFAA